MFYIGFLSTSVPYAVFILASVFYLGYNYLNKNNIDETTQSTNIISVEDYKPITCDTRVNFQYQNDVFELPPKKEIHIYPIELQSWPTETQTKPWVCYTENNLWARPPPYGNC